MAYTQNGLVDGGNVEHYTMSYDTSLSAADGVGRVNGLLAVCEADFEMMRLWFGNIEIYPSLSYPIIVKVGTGATGGSWLDPAPIVSFFGYQPTVMIEPGSGTPVSLLRYLLVSEVTEMFMLAQNKGWVYPQNIFQGGDEGSKGEGLSRFLGAQCLIANGFGPNPPDYNGVDYRVTSLWLNSPRANYVDNNPDDHKPDATTGCTTLFLYYLNTQLGFNIDYIIANGSSTLAGVWEKLTGLSSGAWDNFIKLINLHYPQDGTYYTPLGDNLFPVSNLASWSQPEVIPVGTTDFSSTIFLDNPAMAQINVYLESADPSAVRVPPIVTIPPGQAAFAPPITAISLATADWHNGIPVTATYAGKTVTTTVSLGPPVIHHGPFVEAEAT